MLMFSSLPRRLSLSMAALGFAAVASISSLPGAAAAAQRGAEFVSIQGSAVNVREKPTTRSATLWEMGRGYPLQITQRKVQ